MSQGIDVSHENIYYGSMLAVEDVNVHINPRSVTALIGPSGCGKSTFLRSLNRMHEVIPGARVEGEVLIVDGQNIYGPGIWWTFAGMWVWCSSAPTRSLPCPLASSLPACA